ncbi:hypothetical protein E2C01_096863 [Portunus trituberculatus]|uniref:Uncharacterized protein n=1 Tax=Portunus trituberculatus TaxID=210409 RepID=A0A5B7JTM4_PORTR|nr:hypothetical protein [Portunus trituberculatus]
MGGSKVGGSSHIQESTQEEARPRPPGRGGMTECGGSGWGGIVGVRVMGVHLNHVIRYNPGLCGRVGGGGGMPGRGRRHLRLGRRGRRAGYCVAAGLTERFEEEEEEEEEDDGEEEVGPSSPSSLPVRPESSSSPHRRAHSSTARESTHAALGSSSSGPHSDRARA